MRILVACSFVLAACGGPTKKAPMNDTNDSAVENCCCKWSPLTSEDGRPVYEAGNRMECSSKQGECVDEIQCVNQGKPEPAPAEPTSSDPPPPPDVE
jgi:hypothetical protein